MLKIDQTDLITIARENFDTWNEALKSRDAELISSLYTDNATFLPTISPELKAGIAGEKDYFIHFMEKEPIGKIIEDVIQPIDDNIYVHCGMYDFTLDSKNGREVVKARFTFIWMKDEDGNWQIMHHHSSLKPKAE